MFRVFSAFDVFRPFLARGIRLVTYNVGNGSDNIVNGSDSVVATLQQ